MRKTTASMLNIKELLEQIDSAIAASKTISDKKENVLEVLSRYDYQSEDWRQYYFHDSSANYTRNLVAENKNFSMQIICWSVGKKTAIHNHPSDGCWVYCVKGEVREHLYKSISEDALEEIRETVFKEGQITWLNDSVGYHSMGNSSQDEVSVTLHVYSPPIHKCSLFLDGGKRRCESEIAFYSKDGVIINHDKQSF